MIPHLTQKNVLRTIESFVLHMFMNIRDLARLGDFQFTLNLMLNSAQRPKLSVDVYNFRSWKGIYRNNFSKCKHVPSTQMFRFSSGLKGH